MEMTQACVSVIDDDALVLRSLRRLLESAGFAVRTFSSAQAFLERRAAGLPGCVVMDLSMPGLDGLQLQQALADSADTRPVVFISGRGSVPASVAAMKAGALDFLTKPLDEQTLIAAVRNAIAKDRTAREKELDRASVCAHLATLTPREHQVLHGVVAGMLNKQIAAELGTAEKTIKVHRGRIMRKMQVASLAGLVRAWTLTQPPRAG
jgi:FixJ family two-component response regulator